MDVLHVLDESLPADWFQDCIGISEDKNIPAVVDRRTHDLRSAYQRSRKSPTASCLPCQDWSGGLSGPKNTEVAQDQVGSIQEILVKQTPELQQFFIAEDSRHRLAPLHVNRKLFAEELSVGQKEELHSNEARCNGIKDEGASISTLTLICTLLALCSFVLVFKAVDGTSLAFSIYTSANLLPLNGKLAMWYHSEIASTSSNLQRMIWLVFVL
mmetsp:Transcript_34475/g.108099  ORF Transcript_34475/g.108099 Transcript_34475/m.108099 type:complete len:213 (-) Transcript_34475:360-998(-)